MRVIESERGVSVAEDHDEDGRVVYCVIRGKELLTRLTSLQDAEYLAKVVRPRRVSCSKCGQADVESFPAELGAGWLRMIGVGGWTRERFFGGKMDFEDVVLCPDCVKKHQGG
jgi:hypothetical protein